MDQEAMHTPGPWEFDGPEHAIIVWSDAEHRVCFMTSDGPARANARLISAAPDMFEALEFTLSALLEDGHGEESLYVKRARAALAKARGQ